MSRGGAARATDRSFENEVESEVGAEWVEPEEIGPRLILFAPPELAHAEIAARIRASVCEAVAAVVADVRGEDAAASARAVATVRSGNVAWLALSDTQVPPPYSIDGVHLSDPSHLEGSRAQLAADTLLGTEVPPSRHDAMVAGEDGADYLLVRRQDAEPADLAPTLDVIAWWSAISVLPIGILGSLDERDTERAVMAGADFIGLDATAWRRSEGPETLVRRLSPVLQTTRRTQ